MRKPELLFASAVDSLGVLRIYCCVVLISLLDDASNF